MMTKKHFKAIADIVKKYGPGMHPTDHATMALDFVLMLKKENPRFQSDAFYGACGLTKDQRTGIVTRL